MNLKSFREDKLKIKTQSAFAELLGVEQSSVSQWEEDPNSIPVQIIQRILEKTGVSYEELTGWEKPVLPRLKYLLFLYCTHYYNHGRMFG